jgi:hypothetical protein
MNRMIKITLTVCILFLIGAGLAVNKATYADEGVSCIEISFFYDGQRYTDLNDLDFQLNEQGVFETMRVRVDIQIRDTTVLAGNNFSVGYRWGYMREGFDWVVRTQLALERVTQNEPIFATKAEENSVSSVYMNIDAPGNWKYAFEDSTNRGIVGAGGCPDAESEPDKYTDFVIEVAENNVSVWAGSCGDLERRGFSLETESRFSCTNAAGTGAAWSGNVSPTNENLCYPDEGFVEDEIGCNLGITYHGQVLSPQYGAYCLPCITPAQRDQREEAAGHLEACETGRGLNACQQGLTCTRTNSADSGVAARCLKPAASIDTVGGACYFYGPECGTDRTDVNAGVMSCSRGTGTGPTGTCQRVIDAENQCTVDAECVTLRNNPQATCGTFFGVRVCKIPGEDDYVPPERPDDTLDDDYAYSTEQFGAIRCPVARYTILTPAQFRQALGDVLDQESEGLYMSEDAARERKANGQPVYVVPYHMATADERLDFAQCVECINAGATWTGGFGCIATDIQGLFNSLIRVVLGVMGGVALIRLIILGYRYQFEDKADLKPTVQDILATLGGLLLVLFSVLILRFIGVNLLDIVPPGFFGG